jgi:hypothetical protein
MNIEWLTSGSVSQFRFYPFENTSRHPKGGRPGRTRTCDNAVMSALPRHATPNSAIWLIPYKARKCRNVLPDLPMPLYDVVCAGIVQIAFTEHLRDANAGAHRQ